MFVIEFDWILRFLRWGPATREARSPGKTETSCILCGFHPGLSGLALHSCPAHKNRYCTRNIAHGSAPSNSRLFKLKGICSSDNKSIQKLSQTKCLQNHLWPTRTVSVVNTQQRQQWWSLWPCPKSFRTWSEFVGASCPIGQVCLWYVIWQKLSGSVEWPALSLWKSHLLRA